MSKVAAHQQVHSARSPLEEWCFWHNHLVDQAANSAQWSRPQNFWGFYSAHVHAVDASLQISRQVQHVLLKISRAVVQEDRDAEDGVREELCCSPPVPSGAWSALPELTIPATAVRWYGDPMVRTILSWFWQAVSEPLHPVVWVSQWQLYLDFSLCGEFGALAS